MCLGCLGSSNGLRYESNRSNTSRYRLLPEEFEKISLYDQLLTRCYEFQNRLSHCTCGAATGTAEEEENAAVVETRVEPALEDEDLVEDPYDADAEHEVEHDEGEDEETSEE